MKVAICSLKSASPYSQSRHYSDDVPKLDKESHADYEKRTWRERCWYTKEGEVFVPPMSFKKSLDGACKFLGEKIKGRGQATWSKHFLAGVLCTEPLVIKGVTRDTLKGEWFFVPSDGIAGSGSRVSKCFPNIPEWKGVVNFYILDESITPDVFERHLKQAGTFVGIGRFRPSVGGFFGRFLVESIKWQDA